MEDSPRLYKFVTENYKDDKMFLITPELIFCSDCDIFYDYHNNRFEQNTFLNLGNTLTFGIKTKNKFWKY